ncbi:hypothetical protein FOZ63_008771, partial [Perkinsus olseni]
AMMYTTARSRSTSIILWRIQANSDVKESLLRYTTPRPTAPSPSSAVSSMICLSRVIASITSLNSLPHTNALLTLPYTKAILTDILLQISSSHGWSMTSEDAIACMKALSYLPTSDAPQEAHIQLLRIIYPFINPYTRDRSMGTVISEVESILHTLAHVQSKTLISKHLSKDNNTL